MQKKRTKTVKPSKNGLKPRRIKSTQRCINP
jgi:hypothetical protein